MDVGTAIIPGSERCRLTHTYNSYDFVEYCNSCNRGACRASSSVVTLNVYGGAQLVHKFCPSQSHFTNELS